MSSVQLLVNGARYEGWKRVTVHKSLTQIAGGFELSVSERWPGQGEKWPIRLGDSCQLYLAGQLAVTGYVEDVDKGYDHQSREISVKGRDRTADLADCSHVGPPSQWKDATLLEIAQDMCFPFGVTVEAEAEGGDPWPIQRANPGDTVLAMISKLAKQRQLLPVTYGDGRLVLTRAGTGAAASGLALGVNIKRARANWSNRERHSKYIVRGQVDIMDLLKDGVMPALPKPDADDEAMQAYADLYTGPKGEATDAVPGRYRPLVIVAESKGDQTYMQRRAAWEAQHRAGKSRSVTYTVAGWTQENGALWTINSLAPVTDDELGIHESLLIETVRFALDDHGGYTTDLTLVPQDAYTVLGETDRASSIQAQMDQDRR